MKLIARTDAPTCLRSYNRLGKNWSDVSFEDKKSIWGQLILIQNGKCAYCERDITDKKRHIEHFYQKAKRPELTFSWVNLFGSCEDAKTCGRNKDRGNYDLNNVIKPDQTEQDPEQFMAFINDGSIACVSPKNANCFIKYTETINCFNLDSEHSHLRSIRQSHLSPYVSMASDYLSFLELDPDNETHWKEELSDLVASFSDYEFYTAIKHIFRDFGPSLD